MQITKDTKVISRTGLHTGRTTGATRRCQLEGCRGERVVVKWDDGRISYPCLKGMDTLPDGSLKIL